jgi:hypothetical protein
MSHRLIRFTAAMILSVAPLSLALSAAPAQAALHRPAVPAASAPSTPRSVTCTITNLGVTTQPLATTVTLDVVCDATGSVATAIKVDGVAVAQAQVPFTANQKVQAHVSVAGALPAGAEVCAEVGEAKACTTVKA